MMVMKLPTRFKQAWQLYKVIPMKTSTVLPDEGFPPMLVNIADDRSEHAFMARVYCKPAAQGYSKKHRVMVLIDGREIPFGRMGQYMSAKRKREGA